MRAKVEKMPGETNLNMLLGSMQPILHQEEFVFCSISHHDNRYSNLDPICRFREDEGLTLILNREQANAAGLAYTSVDILHE